MSNSPKNPMRVPPAATPTWLQDDVEDNIPLTTDEMRAPYTAPIPGNNGKRAPPSQNSSIPQSSGQYAPLVHSDNVKNKGMVHWALKSATMMLCILMIGTAIIGVESVDGVDKTGKLFVATYMLFFSVLLFTFEALEIKGIEWIDHVYKRNFGFLYSPPGKALFIIFIAFLSFGLGEPKSLTFATGFSWALFGVGEFALYLKYPEMFEQ